MSLRSGNLKIKGHLGAGTDGEVWKTDRRTAIKVFGYEQGYYNERDAYQRLADFGVTNELDGFWLPKMIDYDDELLVIEMDVLQEPPYIIDFAKVRIDRPPEFSEEIVRDNEARCREEFEHNWPKVKSLLLALESFQIYYLDARRGNITFPDMR
ncbi:MAG: hypothetical protein QM811_17665 [Pirellulales bacterium]